MAGWQEYVASNPMVMLLLQCGILLFSSFVQSSVGFAFALFSNGLLLTIGMPLPEAVMLSSLASTLQRVVMTSRMNHHVDWKMFSPYILLSLLFVPVGILLLKLLSFQSISLSKQVIGGVILAMLCLHLWMKPVPRKEIRRGWGILAASSSGLLTGMANIGGPPIVFWVHSHDWSNEIKRVAVPAMSLPLVPFQLGMLLLAFGWGIVPPLKTGLAIFPAIFIGCMLGLNLGRRLSVRALSISTSILLLVIGVLCLVDPFLK